MQNHFHLPTEALGILRTDAPHYYREKLDKETENEFVDRIVGNLEKLIEKEDSNTIAAFIAEPVTGASGVIVPPKGYYEKVQTVLNKHDILFWADEVITGFGRTGKPFGTQTFNIEQPDLMSLAKQLSSAYLPISAAAVRGDIHEATLEQCAAAGIFGHGYTYSGHPTACAVALKTLAIYKRDQIFAYAAQRGEYLQQQLAQLNDHPLVGEVRGTGLIAAVELVADKETGQAFNDGKVSAKIIQHCQDNGLILRALAGNAIAFCPPLIITDEEIDSIIERFGDALDKTYQFATVENLLFDTTRASSPA